MEQEVMEADWQEDRGGRGHLEEGGEKSLNQAGWGDLEASLGNRNPVRRPHVSESTLPFTLNEAHAAKEKGPIHVLARAATAWKPGYWEAEAGSGSPTWRYLRVSGSLAWGEELEKLQLLLGVEGRASGVAVGVREQAQKGLSVGV